jgi:hypothetical protein
MPFFIVIAVKTSNPSSPDLWEAQSEVGINLVIPVIVTTEIIACNVGIFPNITNYKDLSTILQATGYAATREPPRILCNPKIHYHICMSSPSVPILSQTNAANTPHHLSSISILILSTHIHPGFPSGLCLSGFSINNL